MQSPHGLSETSRGDAVPFPINPHMLESTAVEVVYDWDLQTDVISWAPSYDTIAGLPPSTLVTTGLGYAEHIAVESSSSRYEAVMAPTGCDTGGGVAFSTVYGLVAAKRSKSTPVWVEDSGRWYADVNDRPCRVHGIIRVITERYEAERLQTAAAQRDPVTGAFTRAHFIEHVTRHLSFSSRKTSFFAMLLINIEQPGKSEPMGDDDLAEAVNRLRLQMRSHEVLARYASSKFATLLEACTEQQAMAAAERLLAAVATGQDDTRPLSARIGIVIAPLQGRTPQALLQFAEEALEAAQHSASGSIALYQPDAKRARTRPGAETSDDIISALNEGRITLALQPVVDAQTRVVAFYEGLVRVKRANGALMLPDTLVPQAEKNGWIPLIDRRVIELAFALLTADRKLVLSINASVLSLNDSGWSEQLRTACRRRPDAARRLTIEVTETCVIADIEAMCETLAAIKPLGVKIAIDDFGSGHSSFRSLRQLPIDYLKIDGVFAQNLAHSQDDRFFIRTLIDLARNLDIPTVAEWVEDEATAKVLAEWGVAYLQGHLFGKAELATLPAATASRMAQRG